MADQENVNKKRLNRQRLAVLVLAASENVRKGECLGSAQLAELVDDTCSEEERLNYVAHLASCESCYREWLSVSREAGGQAKGSGWGNVIDIFSSRRFLAAAGSLCAIAASVVVFWSTPFHHVEKRLMTLPDSGVEMEGTSGSGHMPQEAFYTDTTDGEKGAGEPKETLETGLQGRDELPGAPVVQERADKVSTKSKPEMVAPAPARNRLKEKSGARYLKEEVTGVAADAAEQFVERVVRFCREKPGDEGSRIELLESGRRLIAEQAGCTEQQVSIKRIMALLDAPVEPMGREETCRQILDIIQADSR